MADRETFTNRPVLDTGNLSRTKVRTKARKVWAFMVAVFCVFLYFWICCFQPFPMASRHAHLPYRIQRTCYCRQNETIPKVKAWSTTVPWFSGRGEHNSQRTHLHALVCTRTIRVLHIRHDMTWHHITSNYILSHPPYSILLVTYYIRIHTSIHPHTHAYTHYIYIHHTAYLIMS